MSNLIGYIVDLMPSCVACATTNDPKQAIFEGEIEPTECQVCGEPLGHPPHLLTCKCDRCTEESNCLTEDLSDMIKEEA